MGLPGVAADPRPVFRLPNRYATHFEFEFEVKGTEALLFPLRRMLHEFAGYLRAHDTGVQYFVLTFSHRQAPATKIHIGLSTPERNADRFFALVREQRERTELPAPAIGVGLFATEFAMPTAMQPDLLNGALQQTEELSHTMDRLAARLGGANVHKLKSMAEHRPEASWAYRPDDDSIEERCSNPQFPDRPLWLLPEPRPLESSAIQRITSGPERIESGWWDDGDVHMHGRERRVVQDAVTAIRHGCTIAAAGHRLFPNGERHLRTLAELGEIYPSNLLAETLRVAERCEFSLSTLRYNYPRELVPAAMTASEYLRQLTEAGLPDRWPSGTSARIRAIVEKELALIAELKYEALFPDRA